MDSKIASDLEYNESTEQLIGGMISYLDDSYEDIDFEESDELKNPLCWAIKRIINIQPKAANLENRNPIETQNNSFYENRMNASQIEKACRYKDPYMAEVNRLMYCSTVGHPPNGSAEYFQAAENYALFGKEFLDFPTDIKFPQPMDVACFGDPCSIPSVLTNTQPSGFGMQMGKYAKQFSPAPQQQILVNQTNYCSYPVFPAQNILQPLIYSNPFLMTQYLNTFVKETQINTSLVQQQQFNMTGGIHDRLVYAQMLQQQIQTNQALMSCCFVGNAANRVAKSKNDMQIKIEPIFRTDGSEDNPDLEK